MKENFSKGVQRILKHAKEEAVRLGHSYVGSEHLLLGILKDSNGRAAGVLSSIGCDIPEMKSMIEDMAKPSGGTMTLGHLPLTRRAERILRTTFTEAQNYKEEIANQIHSEFIKANGSACCKILRGDFSKPGENCKKIIKSAVIISSNLL